MSKIGKQPITIPTDIQVALADNGGLTISGKQGTISVPPFRGVKAVLNGSELSFTIASNTKTARSGWGTFRALAANAVAGLTTGFQKTLVLEGVGFRMAKEGDVLVMNLGFSHPVKYAQPAGITFEIEKNTILKISGHDKAQVGQVAAEIRALKKPEPYKGKGFHYSTEVVVRKAGKKAASSS